MPAAVAELPSLSQTSEIRKEPNEEEASNTLPLRRWTRDEYHAMGDAGVFGLWERVQLIEGMIVAVSPKSVPHTTATNRVFKRLSRVFDDQHWTVRKEDPIILDDSTEPEPDVVVARGAEAIYETRHPVPADLSLVVEVSQTTLRADRAQKGRVYARAGVPEYWLLNLFDRLLEVHREPALIDGTFAYQSITLLSASDSVTPLEADDSVIAVRELLP